MSERYTVRVTKDHLVFSAGHFITFNGGECERLHGHNYRVAVEIEGPLDANHYVFDFIALRDRTQEIVNELDHRMLVALKNPLLPVMADENEVEIRFGSKRWIFPRVDCVLLPIENTTVELLARHIAGKLNTLLIGEYHYPARAIRVEVEENFGQTAVCQITP